MNKETNFETLADRLRHERVKRKLTRAELGKAIGHPKPLIYLWETGQIVLNEKILADLAEYFGISINEFLR